MLGGDIDKYIESWSKWPPLGLYVVQNTLLFRELMSFYNTVTATLYLK